MPTSTSRSDQCSNRTEISGAHARAKVHTSGWIRAGQAHEGVVIRDRRSAKARYCCLSHQENTADSEGSRCRKKLLCTTCSSCAFTFIIVSIHGCCHHTHFGSTSHTLSGNLQFCRWSTQFPSCMWRHRVGTLTENTQEHAVHTSYMV